MDIELMWRLKLFRVAGLALCGALACCPPLRSQERQPSQDAKSQKSRDKTDIQKEKVLVLNAKEESKSCLWPVTLDKSGIPETPNHDSLCPYPGSDNRELFLRQGKRTELRVFNRKFLTDYSITIDAVTSLQSLPAIRGLNEAENLSLGSATLIGPPVAKGGAEGLSPRSTAQILYQLLDEGTSSKPVADLDSDRAVIDREKERINAEFDAFAETYELFAGKRRARRVPPGECKGLAGAPDAITLQSCLGRELHRDFDGPDWDHKPYSNEDEFRRVVLRVQDLIAAVKTFGSELAQSDLPAKEQKIELDVAQYENDALVFQANLEASGRASDLVAALRKSTFGKALHKEQLRAFLSQQLKTSQTAAAPNPQDEADMNELLDQYEGSAKMDEGWLEKPWKALKCKEGNHPFCGGGVSVAAFRPGVEDIRQKMQVELADAVNSVNKTQSMLLNRVNALYDNSAVPEPLVKQIDISGHSGNLIVYYTIRRIETFTRFTVSPVSGLGAPAQSNLAALNAAPPSKGAATPDTTTPPAPAASDNSGTPPGIVVSKGSFEVHSFFSANVAAAFAVSSLKDQSIAKQPTPQGCTGTATTPDTNCFTPILNGGSRQHQAILALDYYIHQRDTFPRDKYPNSVSKQWLCTADVWQCVGPMGGISMNSASNFFLGAFFEPALGVQISGGANFGSETTLQKSYQANTPVDITGDFPTYQKRATGWFVSAGLDLGIFRKIFGKVTGIGTAASGTQGN